MYFLFIMSKLLYTSQTKVDSLLGSAFDAYDMLSNGMKSPAWLGRVRIGPRRVRA